MSAIGVVKFEIGGTLYAIDIDLAREIVEMVPITPVPGVPQEIEGIINLRGEVTNILNLNKFLGLSDAKNPEERKIIVLVPARTGNSNTGIIVDNVHSVIQAFETDIDPIDNMISEEAYVKGVIKQISEDGKSQELIIWIDLGKILDTILFNRSRDNSEEKNTAST
ncbi:purine-binding chemotaxis protein CheW [Methanoplanus sp. FWC-SCC4]|uniref:Purine-binding chemotaxis protein CheW n=1 Tax=Methanochimaera problematica TaxID=2609417 RepID=A0AA97FEK7_9EURY|nr:chemotaxis protein CheW [Methanoplanus sp. FWC-SCC4]WOF16613.1 purine-binding chemotaxis protein CheW [Methanoplanus sp. FWC-SCC4]